ncbi:MAG: hypothetical protein LBG65_07815 [Puniceicoccales bacterium]|jgi:hypothetical protein|nr:hypothetical protein [Puniceicoccales bacterium]
MAANTETRVTIRLDGNTAGAKPVQNTIKNIRDAAMETQKQVTALGRSFNSMSSMAKNAFVFSGISTFSESIMRPFREFPLSMDSIIERGRAFNLAMDDARNAVAGMLRNSEPQKFKSVAMAVGAAGDAIARLREAAKGGVVTSRNLISAWQAAAPEMTRAGVSLERQTKIIGDFSKATATYGFEAAEIGEDFRKIFSGKRGEKNAAADWLGMGKEEISRARNDGTLAGLFPAEEIDEFLVVPGFGKALNHGLGHVLNLSANHGPSQK